MLSSAESGQRTIQQSGRDDGLWALLRPGEPPALRPERGAKGSHAQTVGHAGLFKATGHQMFQELLEHKDSKTTMIDLHVLNRGPLGTFSSADRLSHHKPYWPGTSKTLIVSGDFRVAMKRRFQVGH
jgi:hypothetical protein